MITAPTAITIARTTRTGRMRKAFCALSALVIVLSACAGYQQIPGAAIDVRPVPVPSQGVAEIARALEDLGFRTGAFDPTNIRMRLPEQGYAIVRAVYHRPLGPGDGGLVSVGIASHDDADVGAYLNRLDYVVAVFEASDEKGATMSAPAVAAYSALVAELRRRFGADRVFVDKSCSVDAAGAVTRCVAPAIAYRLRR